MHRLSVFIFKTTKFRKVDQGRDYLCQAVHWSRVLSSHRSPEGGNRRKIRNVAVLNIKNQTMDEVQQSSYTHCVIVSSKTFKLILENNEFAFIFI
jgi:hypothetical protein